MRYSIINATVALALSSVTALGAQPSDRSVAPFRRFELSLGVEAGSTPNAFGTQCTNPGGGSQFGAGIGVATRARLWRSSVLQAELRAPRFLTPNAFGCDTSLEWTTPPLAGERVIPGRFEDDMPRGKDLRIGAVRTGLERGNARRWQRVTAGPAFALGSNVLPGVVIGGGIDSRGALRGIAVHVLAAIRGHTVNA